VTVDPNAGLVDQRVRAFVDRAREQLAEKLQTSANGDEHRLKSAAFAVLCLQAWLSLDEEAAIDALTDGGQDIGVDALHIGDVVDGEFVVTVLQSKYSKSLEAKAGYPGNSIVRVVNTVRVLFDPAAAVAANSRLEELVAEVRGLILDGNIPEVRVLLCNNGKRWEANGEADITSSGLPSNRVTFSHLNHDKLIELLQRKKSVDAHLRLSGKAIVDDFDHRRVLVGRLPVSEVKALFDGSGDGLLDRNIRRYLGLRDNRVNLEIHRTLTDPKRRGNFYFFNNGITAVCQKFTHNALQGENWEVHVKGLQIVNGGQTSKTIQTTIDRNPSDYTKTYVLLRLYELSSDDDGLVDNITFATNSQNPVDLTDLRSNDPVQERLALALRDLGFEYKRKRDDQNVTTADTITAAVAAEAVMAVWRKRPHAAKFRRSRLFSDFYDEIFSEDLQAAHVILSVLVFRIIENERKRPRQRRPRFVQYASHFLAMIAGELLLQRAGVDREEVDHTTLVRLREALEADRAAIYSQAIRHLEVVLKRLGVDEGTPLQRVAAQFRRGDLLDPLQDELTKLARRKTETRKPSSSSARGKRPPRPSNPGAPATGTIQSFELNGKEHAILGALDLAAGGLHLADLGKKAFPSAGANRGNSWARNSVRKPLRLRLVEHVGKGKYTITAAGRRALGEAAGFGKHVQPNSRPEADRNGKVIVSQGWQQQT
jgi:hypothetical protein